MELEKRISNWIKRKVKEAGAIGGVIGLSGGLDSAVVAVLAKKALKDNVLGVILPCYSEPEDIEDAYLIANTFNIKTEKIILDSVYDEITKILPKGDKISLANIKARLRMIVLYYFANKLNYLVIGTGNKSELAIGYFTKYGDGGVDILPLGGLLKTQIFELAKKIGIPEKIINKKPSAGLWKNQTDEEEIGISYPDLDRAIIAIERGDKNGPIQIINKVKQLMEKTKHKKQKIPILKC